MIEKVQKTYEEWEDWSEKNNEEKLKSILFGCDVSHSERTLVRQIFSMTPICFSWNHIQPILLLLSFICTKKLFTKFLLSMLCQLKSYLVIYA